MKSLLIIFGAVGMLAGCADQTLQTFAANVQREQAPINREYLAYVKADPKLAQGEKDLRQLEVNDLTNLVSQATGAATRPTTNP